MRITEEEVEELLRLPAARPQRITEAIANVAPEQVQSKADGQSWSGFLG